MSSDCSNTCVPTTMRSGGLRPPGRGFPSSPGSARSFSARSGARKRECTSFTTSPVKRSRSSRARHCARRTMLTTTPAQPPSGRRFRQRLREHTLWKIIDFHVKLRAVPRQRILAGRAAVGRSDERIGAAVHQRMLYGRRTRPAAQNVVLRRWLGGSVQISVHEHVRLAAGSVAEITITGTW